MPEQVHIIYHRADMDGILSAATVYNWLKRNDYNLDIVLHPWDYGDEVPLISEETTLFMVDISVEELMGHPRLIWIDHHRSAIERYGDRDLEGFRLEGVGACRLTWQYMMFLAGDTGMVPPLSNFKGRLVSEPYCIRIAGEYDVWDRTDEEARAFQIGARVYDEKPGGDIPKWAEFLRMTDSYQADKTTKAGFPILRYLQNADEKKVLEMGYLREWEGRRFLCLNGRGNSLSFEGSPLLPDADALLMWWAKEGVVKVSLYHHPDPAKKEGVDLSKTAVKYGGGGHPGACGFRMTPAEFFASGVL